MTFGNPQRADDGVAALRPSIRKPAALASEPKAQLSQFSGKK